MTNHAHSSFVVTPIARRWLCVPLRCSHSCRVCSGQKSGIRTGSCVCHQVIERVYALEGWTNAPLDPPSNRRDANEMIFWEASCQENLKHFLSCAFGGDDGFRHRGCRGWKRNEDFGIEDCQANSCVQSEFFVPCPLKHKFLLL